MTSHAFGLYPSFAYGLGGTTNFWQGGLVELSEDEMGTAWPDALKSELPPYYGRVVRQLYGDRALRAWYERDRADRVGDILSTQLFYPPRPFRAADSGFLTLGHLRTGHVVERVEEKADSIEVVSRAEGKQVVERFDRVVVAAGGLNSPLVLQRSGIGGTQVGRNLTDHPMGFVAKLRAEKPSDVFSKLRAKRSLYARSESMLKVYDEETGLWSAFYLRSAFGPGFDSDPYSRSFKFLAETKRSRKYLAALPHLRDRDFLWQSFENQLWITLPSSYAYVLVLNEQEAMGQGSVRGGENSRPLVDWRISDAVENAIKRNMDRLAVYTGAELSVPEGSLHDRLWSAAHHSGTCRISPDQNTGVVDQDLRVHGSQHIYVCDGSVLPSTGASNTGLTIAALAHRLADQLRADSSTRIASSKRRDLVISGATGVVGRMMRARLADLPFDWHDVDLRSDDQSLAGGHLKNAVFLHLANAHGSVEENLRLQERAAAFADKAGITQVIVPMSTSTIEVEGPRGQRPYEENFGFSYKGDDPYPKGKLAAERFWLAWQAAKPGRKLALVYIPTITGPRSKWTETIANHAPGKTLIVPQIDRFVAVSETRLVDFLSELAEAGLPDGVTRHLVVTSEDSLPATIVADRGEAVRVVRLPRFVWSMLGSVHRHAMVQKALSATRVLSDRLLRATLGFAIVPIAPRYLHLFRCQSDMAVEVQTLESDSAEAR